MYTQEEKALKKKKHKNLSNVCCQSLNSWFSIVLMQRNWMSKLFPVMKIWFLYQTHIPFQSLMIIFYSNYTTFEIVEWLHFHFGFSVCQFTKFQWNKWTHFLKVFFFLTPLQIVEGLYFHCSLSVCVSVGEQNCSQTDALISYKQIPSMQSVNGEE